MKNRKVVSVLAAAMMAAGMLAGCGSSSSSTSASTTAATTAATEAASTEVAAETASTEAAADTASSPAPVSGEVTAAGSSALLPLAQAAAEKFMEANPDCVVTVNGGGSGEGLKQVADGSVDIGNSDVFAEEKLDADSAAKLVDHEVCTITMAPVVNKDLGVTNLTTDQLISIFTGKTTNWSEVGGPDEDILLVTRPSSSGTRTLFKTWALNGEEEASNASLETDDSGTLLQTVEQNKGAIGYVALSYLVNDDNVQAVSIEAAQAFINYVMGDDFASDLESMGYGVTSKMSDAAVSAHAAQ